MERTEIAATVGKIIKDRVGLTPNREILPEGRLKEDFGADSLDEVEVVMALEDEFDLEIPDEDVQAWVTVNDVTNYIHAKKGGA